MIVQSKIKLTALILTASLLLSQDAMFAQFVKRKQLDVDVEEVKRERGQGITKNRLNRSAIFTVEVEKKLIRAIDKTIAFYERQYKRMSKGSSARLNIMTRILQLHLEQATYIRNEEEREYDRRWMAWDANGRKGREPKLNTRKSFRHWKAVIAQADKVMAEYPRNKEADRIIFTKGFALSYIGREKESARIYTQLIQKYPNSNVAGDAYASLGDFYFDRNDFRNALNNYQKALRYKQSDRYLWSLFKLGWCYYNLGNNETSLKYWKEVVRQARGRKGSKLREEAMRDMVYAFAELKDVKGAIAYYKANRGEAYIGSLLQLLAQELADDGNYPEAIKTLKLFQRMLPTDPAAPEMQKELCLLVYELGKLDVLWKELDFLHERYGTNGAWARANAKDRKLVLETKKMVKDQRIYYAKVLHKRGQKRNSVPLHKHAKIGYIAFLQHYPRSKEVAEVKFNLADIEYFLKDYRAAGKQYMDIVLKLGRKGAVVYDPDSGKPKGNVHRESALYMVEAFAKDFEGEFKALKKQKPNFDKPPRQLSSKAKNYIKACAAYVKNYPKDEKRNKVCETDIARIFYHTNNRKKAREYLWVIAKKYPNGKEGPAAVELLIPLYGDNKEQLLTVADRLLAIPAYRKGKLGDKLRALKRGAEKESVAKVNDPLKRAKRYQQLAEKNPSDPEADALWYNAGNDYLKAGAVPAAIAAYLAIVKKYPKSKQAPDSLLTVAQLYEKRLDFAPAASFFEAYANKYPKDSKSKASLARSCELLIAIDSNKAINTCMAFAKRFPGESADLVNRLIIGTQRAKRYDQMSALIMRSYLNKYRLSPNEKIVANYRIYSAYGGNGKAAQGAARNILGEFKRARGKVEGEALRYVGELKFKIANNAMPEFAKLKLSGGTVQRLQASIESKASGLLNVKSGFEAVLATEDSYWGVAALHQLGIAHEQFAALLENPPAIQGAKPEDVKKQLGPQAQGLRKEALNYYRTAMQLVNKFKVYNDWSIKIINAFQRVTDSKVQFQDFIVTPDFVGSEVSSTVTSAVKTGG